ncbi:MAG: GNAT family N-acetyltransferase [Candidatus Acidiferrales bacterium]
MATTKNPPGLQLFTPRLELISATVELARAEINNLPAFAAMLDVPLPAAWPPPLNDEQLQRFLLSALEKSGPNETGWHLWFCIRRDPRALLGNIGFKGAPKDGVADIGYSLLEAHQGNGYCTEAARALIGWAFQHSVVAKIVADTLPELVPSIRVMEKSGMEFIGDGPIEDGMHTIRYELTRERYMQLYHSG